jgi:hypothetical protein
MKPSPGRPSLIAEIIAAIAPVHTSGDTLLLIPLSATISAYRSATDAKIDTPVRCSVRWMPCAKN